jgi:hypothetical protein
MFNRPKHLLMIAPQYNLHFDTRIIDMSNCFAEAGSRVSIVCPPQQTDNRADLQQLLNPNASVYQFPPGYFDEADNLDLQSGINHSLCSPLQRYQARWLNFARGKKAPEAIEKLPVGMRFVVRRLAGKSADWFNRLGAEATKRSRYWEPNLAMQIPPAMFQKYKDVIWLDYSYFYFIQALVVHRTIAPIDCIYVNDLWALPAGCLLKEVLQVPLIYDAHDIGTTVIPDPQLREIAEKNQKWMYQMCDSVVTVNGSCAEYFSSRFPFMKPVVITNGHRFPWQKPPETISLKERLSIPANAPLAVYVGTLHQLSHLDRFIQAIAQCKSNLHLAILGGEGEIERYKQICKDLDLLDKRVFFLGFVHYRQVHPTLYGADFGIIPNIQAYFNHGMNSSSKMFDYIQVKMPFISDHGLEMQKIVDQFKVGETVDFQSEPVEIARLLDNFWARVNAGDFSPEELRRAQQGLVWPSNVVELVCPPKVTGQRASASLARV